MLLNNTNTTNNKNNNNKIIIDGNINNTNINNNHDNNKDWFGTKIWDGIAGVFPNNILQPVNDSKI